MPPRIVFTAFVTEPQIPDSRSISFSTRTLSPAAFASALEAGEYTLVVATRSGLSDEFGVKTATRKVRIG